ncbi:MAG: ABC transporter permease [Vicinamibacteraceae bacterium]
MPYELQVAVRYLIARRRQAFVSLISFVSTLGVAVGVTALVVALALMTGLQGELRDRMLGSMPHVYVAKIADSGVADPVGERTQLLKLPHVVGAAPVVIGPALVRAGERSAFVTLKGVDPATESSVTELPQRMTAGRFDALATPADPSGDGPRLDGIALGKDLAVSLAVRPGDVVTVLTPEGTLTPMGVMPRARSLRVTGIFSLGLYEFDSAYAVVALPVGLRLMGKPYPDYIQLKVDDVYQAHTVAEAIVAKHGAAYQVQDWAQMNQSLFSALQLEKMAVSITIGLIVMVAALNIVASLVLMVMEKSRDIAILKTMGATRRSISIVFMLQGTLIGLAGTLAGVVLGLGLSFVLDRYKLVRIPTDVYQISYVPFAVDPLSVTVVALSALLICFLATIYPSRQAARLDPAEALRHG